MNENEDQRDLEQQPETPEVPQRRTSRREFVKKAGKVVFGVGMAHFMLLSGESYAGSSDDWCLSGLEKDDYCLPPDNVDYCPGGASPEDKCGSDHEPPEDECPGHSPTADECPSKTSSEDTCTLADDDVQCHLGIPGNDKCNPPTDPDICPLNAEDKCGTGEPPEDECPGGYTSTDVCDPNHDATTDYCGKEGSNATDSCESGKSADDQCPPPYTDDVDVCKTFGDSSNDECDPPGTSGSDKP